MSRIEINLPKVYDSIIEFASRNQMCKIKRDCFYLNKVRLSFVSFEPNSRALIDNMDIYLSFEEFFALYQDIISGRLPRIGYMKKQSNSKDNKALYFLQGGGAVENPQTHQKELKARYFLIDIGTKSDFVFRCIQRKGYKKGNLIVPTGDYEKSFLVSLSLKNLKSFAHMVKMEITNYNMYCYINGVYNTPAYKQMQNGNNTIACNNNYNSEPNDYNNKAPQKTFDYVGKSFY